MTIKNIVIRKKLEGTATEILYPVTSIENVTGLSSLLTTINTNLEGKSDTGHKHEWSDINTGKDKPIRIDNFKNSALHRTVSLGAGNNLKAYTNWTADEKNGGHRIWTIRFPTNNGNTSPKFWGKIKISFIASYSSFNASGLISKEINISFNGGSLYNNVGRYVDLSGNIENDFRISELILNTSLNCWEIKIYSEKASGNNTPRDVTIEGWFTDASHENTLKDIEFITTPEISKDTTYTANLATVTNITSSGVTLGTKVVNWSDTPRFETPYGREIATVQEMVRSVNNQTPDASGNVSLTIPDISTLQQTLTNKRDIVTATNQVYTTGSTVGTQSSIGFSDAVVNNSIVRRTANGRIKAANATENGDVTTFGQVVRATTEDKNILGTTQGVFNISEKKVWFDKGALFYGTAAAAGLVTRGISGVKTDGSAKDHLYINYDGNNTLSRQLVLGAGSPGESRGYGIYDYSAVRGDAFINYLTNTLGSYENTANKITSIRTNATDTAYVSELGVKTYVDGLIGSVYRPAGDWNAATNTPALANNTPANAGKVYRVSVAGTRFGFTFAVGDKIAFNESGVISKWDNIDDVTSVNGQTGTVNLTTDNVPQGSNLYVSQGEKNKLSGIQTGAQVNKIESISLDGEELAISSNKDVSIPTIPIHAWAMEEDKPSYDLGEIAETTTYKRVSQSEKNTWNTKQSAITGAATTITSSDLTKNRALISNGSGKVAVSPVTSTELGYLSGVTSSIQTQLSNKANDNDVVKLATSGSTIQAIDSCIDISNTSIPFYSTRKTTANGGIYATAMFTREITTGTPADGNGPGVYFRASNSTKAITHAGIFGGRLAVATQGAEVGEIVLGPAWRGADPYQRADFRVRARSASIADAYINGKFYAENTKEVATQEWVTSNTRSSSWTPTYTDITGLGANKVLGRTTGGTGEVQALDTIDIGNIAVSNWTEVWSGSINLNSYRGGWYIATVPSNTYIGKRIAIEVQYGSGTTYTSKIIFGVLGSSSATGADPSVSKGIGWNYFDGTYLRVKTLFTCTSTSNTTTIYVGNLKTLFGKFTGTTIEWSTSYSETLYMKKIWVIE